MQASLISSLLSLSESERRAFFDTLTSAELDLVKDDLNAHLRTDFGAYCDYVMSRFDQRRAAHHRFLTDKLQEVADGKIKRLLVNMPPGSAKSTYASKLFPAWLMSRGWDIIGAANTQTLAEQFSRAAQGFVREDAELLGCTVTRESAELWETSNGGRYRAAGVGGVITGMRAHIALIDDPVKSRADAESETLREKQWSWFIADLRTRLKPGAPIVLIMTRWHLDDLGGRVLDRQGNLWHVVSIPAQAKEDDPIGRQPGEWLWDGEDNYGYGAELRATLSEYENAGAMRDWAALYQQSPVATEGALFKAHMIEMIDTLPAGIRWARGWDLAATAALGTRNPDWTAGVMMGCDPSGKYVIANVTRMRGGPDEVRAMIKHTAQMDGHGTRISIPQDPGQAGKAQALDFVRLLSGFTVEATPETGDKATRAAPFAAQVNAGNVQMLRGDWNAAYLDELASFPGGVKDDQVDASSRAFAMVSANPPMRIDQRAIDALKMRAGRTI